MPGQPTGNPVGPGKNLGYYVLANIGGMNPASGRDLDIAIPDWLVGQVIYARPMALETSRAAVPTSDM